MQGGGIGPESSTSTEALSRFPKDRHKQLTQTPGLININERRADGLVPAALENEI